MIQRYSLFLSAVMLLGVPSVVSAQGTMTWNFGVGSGSATASSSTGSGATAGSFTIGNSFSTANPVTTPLTNTNPSNNTGASGDFNFGTSVSTGTFNATTSPYFEVTLTSTTGAIQLDNFTFNMFQDGTGANRFTIRTDGNGDNFATDLATGTLFTANTWTAETGGTAPGTILTTGAGGTARIRLYVYSGSASATASVINTRIDDVFISYSPVPEPATILGLSAMGMGLVGLTRRVRNSRKS